MPARPRPSRDIEAGSGTLMFASKLVVPPPAPWVIVTTCVSEYGVEEAAGPEIDPAPLSVPMRLVCANSALPSS